MQIIDPVPCFVKAFHRLFRALSRIVLDIYRSMLYILKTLTFYCCVFLMRALL